MTTTEIHDAIYNPQFPRPDLSPCPHCGAVAVQFDAMGEFWIVCAERCQDMRGNLTQAEKQWQLRKEQQ